MMMKVIIWWKSGDFYVDLMDGYLIKEGVYSLGPVQGLHPVPRLDLSVLFWLYTGKV